MRFVFITSRARGSSFPSLRAFPGSTHNEKAVAGTLSVAFLSAAAQAQSSVTLYGMLDAGIVYTNNQSGKSAWQQGSGLLSNTVFGLSGNEDLGGGCMRCFASKTAST